LKLAEPQPTANPEPISNIDRTTIRTEDSF
jgi:hypothetical protein